jgi:hypothetical protein
MAESLRYPSDQRAAVGLPLPSTISSTGVPGHQDDPYSVDRSVLPKRCHRDVRRLAASDPVN